MPFGRATLASRKGRRSDGEEKNAGGRRETPTKEGPWAVVLKEA